MERIFDEPNFTRVSLQKPAKGVLSLEQPTDIKSGTLAIELQRGLYVG